MRRRVALGAVAAVGVVCGLAAQRAPARGQPPTVAALNAPPRPMRSGTAFILGGVADTAGRPVAYPTVSLIEAPPSPIATGPRGTPAPPNPATSAIGPVAGFSKSVDCDAAGEFVLYDLPSGSFNLSATAPGFTASSVPLTLRDSQHVGDAMLELPKSTSLGGTVLDEFGDPVPGIDVEVVAASQGTPGGGFVRTDDRGVYRVDRLRAGDYNVITPASYITSGNQLPEMLALLGGGVTGVGSTISATGSFHVGSVEIQPWNPLARLVPPPQPNKPFVVYPTTFAPGTVSRASARTITLAEGDTQLSVDVHLKMVETLRVSGRLHRADGAGVGNELVKLSPTGGTALTAVSGVTDPLGRFT